MNHKTRTGVHYKVGTNKCISSLDYKNRRDVDNVMRSKKI